MDHSNQRNKPDENLPLLLAGPIIRRVDKSRVCIWISTSKNVQAQVKIYRIIKSKNGKENWINENNLKNSDYLAQSFHHKLQAIGEGVNSPLQLGENLFVNLIVAKPLDYNNGYASPQNDKNPLVFPTNELLAYDLELNVQSREDSNEIVTLRDLGLLSGRNSILYDFDTNVHYQQQRGAEPDSKTGNKAKSSFPSLPTFFIPDTKHDFTLNILYGSCRKLHGDDEDSLIIGDKLMQNTFYDIERRPSALFLIGDQIYADGVAGPLIKYLTRYSNKLLGWEESIDGLDTKLSDFRIGARQEIVRKYANFSSESAGNHLLGFGEFAAMYLVAWNQLNWPEHFDLQTKDAFTNSSTLQDYTVELEELEESRRNLVGIRRLLANIPSYMICDDHEITDDWNINKRWQDEVNQSVAGTQIISNGLVAYWAFQAWGNDPESFDKDFIAKVKWYLDAKKQKNIGAITPYTNTLTTTNLISNPQPKSDTITTSEFIKEFENRVLLARNWTFVAPTYPLTVFLDCRTQRTFIDKEGPPFLLSDGALDHVKTQLYRHGYQNGNPIIIVSPTPVFGFELAESVQRFLTTISGSYKWDLETWRANEQGFIRFLMYLISNFNPNYCIFVSGDVHYAFTMKADIDHVKTTTTPDDNAGKEVEDSRHQFDYRLPIAQLTSSPFRSNSLRNRIVAILILNLFHKLIVSKKNILRYGFRRYGDSSTHLNYDYHRGLKIPSDYNDEKNPENIHLYANKESPIHFSKYELGQSILDKIRIISSNLLTRYFHIGQDENTQKENLPWVEHRLLVKPRGLFTLPVLPKNNMGNVYLDLNSKTVKHTLYYLDKKGVNRIEASISFN